MGEPSADDRGRLVGASCVVIASLGLAAYGLYLRDRRADVLARLEGIEAQRADATNATTRLDALRKRHATLTVQVTAIKRVLDTRQSAAELFEAVGRSLTDGLWLSEMRRSAGSIQIDGRASSLLGISGLVQNLEDNFLFDAPLEIRSMTTDAAEGSSILRFQVASEQPPAAGKEGRP